MTLTETRISFSVCLLFLTVIVYSKPTCGPVQYYDGVVSRCSPCEDICLNAYLQGTADQCTEKCPNFKMAPGMLLFRPFWYVGLCATVCMTMTLTVKA